MLPALGAPLRDEHTRVHGWLSRARSRAAVRREAEAMTAYATKALAHARS